MLPAVKPTPKSLWNLSQNVCITMKKCNDYILIFLWKGLKFKGAQNRKCFSALCAIGWENQG